MPQMYLNSYKHCYDTKSIGNFDFPRKILLYKGLYFRPVLFLPFYTQTISFRLNQRGENKTGSNISCRISKDALFPQSNLGLNFVICKVVLNLFIPCVELCYIFYLQSLN